jgi:hypothetical protein
MTKFLDLRTKTPPQVKVIYKTITQRRSWYIELTKILLSIIIVGTIVWGVSRADDAVNHISKVKAFSAIGLVSTTTETTISIDSAHGSDNASTTSYTFDTSTIGKFETNKYKPLLISDIKVGDRVIVQGTSKGDLITAGRLIDFTTSSTATTTDTLATTTPELSTTTSTTTDVTSSSTSTSTLNDVIQNIVNIITGTTTGTSSDNTATTTDDTSTTTEATTTPTTTPEIVPDTSTTPTTTPVIDTSATDTSTSTE